MKPVAVPLSIAYNTHLENPSKLFLELIQDQSIPNRIIAKAFIPKN